MALYPLKFRPRLLEKIWGGRKLADILGKSLPPERLIGESWELYDFPPGVVEGSSGWVSSEIVGGPLAGRSLHDVIKQFGPDLLGNAAGANAGQFPLLIKFLDAHEDLSVQVHPDRAYAQSHPGAHLKTEAWYIVQHKPGARLLKGLRAGTTRDQLREAIAGGDVERRIESIVVNTGQCFYLPSGTVHALGAGILAAEVQTPSDTTFRVFDFNRIEAATGKPRALHVEQALACIHFGIEEAPPRPPGPVNHPFAKARRLVESGFFVMDEVRCARGMYELAGGAMSVWMVLRGSVGFDMGGSGEKVDGRAGETLLLPAAMGRAHVRVGEEALWLEIGVPAPVGR